MSAEQAAKLSDKNVIVIATTAVTQAMSCMLVFDENADPDANKEAFKEAISLSKSAQVTNAVRDTSVDGIDIKEGEYLSIVDGKIKASCQSSELAAEAAIELMADDESLTISLFYGADVSEESAEALAASLEEKYPECDIMLSAGAQPVYHYLISVE